MHHDSNIKPETQSEAATQAGCRSEGSSGDGKGDLGSSDASARTLPESIAGYQHVAEGLIEDGDIFVAFGRVIDFVDGAYIGWNVSDLKHSTPAIYRKMPCAKQGDCDTTNWKVKQDELRAAAFGPHEYTIGNKAKTYDDGKPPLAYLPWAGIDEVAQVQAYGHKKYKDFNNYRKGMEIGRNLSCAIRHIRAFMEGEDLDKESGRNHLAHACCRLLFTLQNIHDGTATDDRFKKGTK